MRHVPEEMASRIESGASTLCHVWLLKRADGVVAGFTDHDRDLIVDGVPCRAASGWTAGAAEQAVGFAPGAGSVSGALDDDRISAADILAGLYDRAEIALWRVDWRRPDLKVRMWVAELAALRRDGERFIADLEGPLAALQRVVGRTYGRECDAVFGDARCGVDRSSFPGATCDKRWPTCVAAFANGTNFRGFPDVPGDDFLMAVPVQGGRNDGRSRR